MRCGVFCVKSAAVPATVSEEPSPKTTGKSPGKAGTRRRSASQETCRLQDIDPIAWRVSRARSLNLELDDNLSVATSDASCDAADARAAEITILVCSSCRDETGSDAHPRAGARLAEDARLAAADGENIGVRSVECLGNCKRRLSAALLRDGAWSYVFGDLDVDSGDDLVTGRKTLCHLDRRPDPMARPPRQPQARPRRPHPPLALIKEDQ